MYGNVTVGVLFFGHRVFTLADVPPPPVCYLLLRMPGLGNHSCGALSLHVRLPQIYPQGQ